MKKSIAIILLGSAILLPNHHVEASHSSKVAKDSPVQVIKCLSWEQSKSAVKQLMKKDKFAFYINWKDFAQKHVQHGKPTPTIPDKEDIEKETPQIEEVPKDEETPVIEQNPGEEQAQEEQAPEEQAPEEQAPEEQAQEVEESTEVEKTPEKPSTPAPTPKPSVPEIAPEESVEQGEQNASVSAIEQEVLNLTNIERQKAGLAPLAIDDKLMNSAREKTKDMSKNNYFSHTSPTYGSPFDQMKAFGVTYRSAAENIASGQRSAEEVVRAWMNSPGHRQNILTANFTHIGIGYDASGNYWTQQFIQK